MTSAPAAHELERRKQVRLRLRKDISITQQRYEGRVYFVVKDPVTLRYWRFKEQERYLLDFMDGSHTLEDAQKEYERRFRPERLTLEDLEGFAQQLLTAGLVQNESPRAGQQLIDRRKKRKRSQLLQALTNILYIRIPLFDPDAILNRMVKYLGFFFSLWFFAIALGVFFSALTLVLTHFDTFRNKLPAYHEFFSFKTVIYLWIALGVVKVIHEFGHGLSCKKFGGEVHEMGLLILCFSPAMYCNVSDAWTLPSKWKRIVISAAGIYVELFIAALATFIWWNTPNQPFINNLSLSLMVVCSVSTIVFNANPLMRYDGYYVLADWIEIPNLRERSNRFLKNLLLDKCLGVEVQPEPYMALWRKILFVFYAVVSWIYRWVVTFFILWFLYNFLKPYRLGVISGMLAMVALGSMIGWPLVNLFKNINRRGRLPDMKSARVAMSLGVVTAVIVGFFTVPLPVSRVTAVGVVEIRPKELVEVPVRVTQGKQERAILKSVLVEEGKFVAKDDPLALFDCPELKKDHARAVELERVQRNHVETVKRLLDETRRAKEDTLTRSDRVQQMQRTVDQALDELSQAAVSKGILEQRLENLVVKAPRAGYVIGMPRREQLDQQWDPSVPLCRIGDLGNMQVLIAVEPKDFSLLQENLGGSEGKQLAAAVRVNGLGRQTWPARVTRLPDSDAKKIPFGLSNRADGPVPIKPSNNPNELVPQTQVYLIEVELPDPDPALRPGLRAKVKIYCKKRTMGWWAWRTIHDLFNPGLL